MIAATSERPPSISFSATASDTPTHATEVAPRWSTLPGGVIAGGEIVLLAIKPSMWRPLLESASWLVTCLLLAGALIWLGQPIPGLSVVASAQLMLFIGFGRLGVAIVRWVPRWYVLTNRRILDIEGVRTPRIWSCPLIEVRNTYLHASRAEKLTGLGTITIVTERAAERPRSWRSIAKSEAVHAKIRRSIENAIDQHGISALA